MILTHDQIHSIAQRADILMHEGAKRVRIVFYINTTTIYEILEFDPEHNLDNYGEFTYDSYLNEFLRQYKPHVNHYTIEGIY